MIYLKQVQYKLPNTNSEFISQFLDYLAPIGEVGNDEIELRQSNDAFFPVTSILFSQTRTAQVVFVFNSNTSVSAEIANTTGVSKTSPHQYSHISVTEFTERISPFKLKYIDHTGFNLPFFNGIHPKILELREKLKNACLYHTFPKHLSDSPWDFILPGTKKEVVAKVETDYSLDRKPKIEIVSFDKSSTPIMQLDIQLEGKYEDWVKIFPEAINVPEMKSPWVYMENDFGIDVCFVLNEAHEKDWSYHFAKDRLL